MSNRANPVLIGAFILGAAALLLAGIVLFAAGAFTRAQKNIIYFEGSVNGLNIGAPVKLKGVNVGKVTDILVIWDDQHAKIITPVIVEFQARKIFDTEGDHIHGATPEDMEKLIKEGLRAQLQMQSLVTGQLFVDVNFHPETPIKLMGGDHPMYPEIPSIPSPKEQLENTFDEVVSRVRKMPIEQTVESLHNSLVAMENLIKSPEVASSLVTLDRTLKDLRNLIQDLDKRMVPIADGLEGSLAQSRSLLETINRNATPAILSGMEAMKAATSAMNQAQATLSALEQTAGQNASLDQALKDLSSAARSLRVLADYLERHPDALLYGKRPNRDE